MAGNWWRLYLGFYPRDKYHLPKINTAKMLDGFYPVKQLSAQSVSEFLVVSS